MPHKKAVIEHEQPFIIQHAARRLGLEHNMRWRGCFPDGAKCANPDNHLSKPSRLRRIGGRFALPNTVTHRNQSGTQIFCPESLNFPAPIKSAAPPVLDRR